MQQIARTQNEFYIMEHFLPLQFPDECLREVNHTFDGGYHFIGDWLGVDPEHLVLGLHLREVLDCSDLMEGDQAALLAVIE